MQRNLRFAFVRLFTVISLFIAAQFGAATANAQSRLVHYWHFNSIANNDTLGATGCIYPLVTPNRIRPIAADYSIIDTSKAKIWYARQPGVSNSYPEIGPYAQCLTFLDVNTSGGTTINAQLGASTGGYLRERNPSDSMELLFYVPATNYQNITLSFAAENSSTTSGPRYMLYDYSLDSGVTWTKTGLSKIKDSAWSIWNQTTITITDPLASNNPKLVFRIKDSVNNTGGTTAPSSGNLRYDNVTVFADTLITTQTLIYFWHFNNLPLPTGTPGYTWNNPNFPYIAPDYFIHDSSKAKVHMGLFPGTSLADATFFDDVQVTPGAPDYDTVNQNWPSVPALPLSVVTPTATSGYVQMAIRPRNPLDSSYLYYYIPSVNYKNLVLKFATQTSSTGSGDSIQLYNYSIDSGLTWRLSGITEAFDSAYVAGMPTSSIPFRPTPITIQFTDPAANNNPKLVFRIGFKGHTGPTGNNRFDNISLQGDSIIGPQPTITTTSASYGPLCSSISNNISVAFTSTGTISGPYLVQITNSAGVFPGNFTSNIIGSGATSPITATIPAGITPGSIYRVRVISAYPYVYGSDNGSDITISSALNPNTGTTAVCSGLTTTLSNIASGGTWTSSNTLIATVGSSSGIVTGVAGGTATVTYRVPSGCTATSVVTVNQTPSNITGSNNVCVASTTALSDTLAGGNWTSSNPLIASVGSGSGIVTGVSSGAVTITYAFSSGCQKTSLLTVNPLPAAISGTTSVCVGNSTTLSDAGGGTWSSSNTSQASIGSTTGTASGIAAGVPTITYTLPTGCYVTTTYTVNANPAPISGSNACIGVGTPFTDATAFGAWSSSNTSVATAGSASGIVTGIGSGTATISYTLSTGCYATQNITVNPVPSSITGTAVMCAGTTTTLSNSTAGGSWSSGNVAVATVGSTGIVTGVAAGTATITYTIPTGCIATQVVTVNANPATIGGATSVYCIGSTANLTDVTGGGVWTSSNPSVATVGSSSGIVTGIAAGSATITYTLPTGCYATIGENITSTPAPITGTATQCVGASANLSDLTAFGAWSSSNTAIATIGSGTGIITGVAAGTVTITYQLSSFCVTTRNFTVNPMPQAITGVASACVGLTSSLSDTGTGTWTSSVPSLATVGATTGIVTGIAAGNPVITYTAVSGCYATTVFTVNPLPGPIGGTGSVYCIGSSSNLIDGTPGGVWTSGNTAIATVGSASGIVTGVSAGSAVITYTLPTGCYSTITENISSTPAPISGVTGACVGNNATYSDLTAFGAWSSSNIAVAAIGSGTGILTGVSAGSATITYQLSPICLITKNITVNPLPGPISGTLKVCPGTTTTLTDAGGGTWTSSIPALAAVGSSSGVVSGIIAGTVNITYTLPTGCMVDTAVTINPLPSVVGPTNICMGLPTTLSSAIGGGTWVSSNTAVATIGSSSGTISAVSLGSTTITYTAPTGCTATSNITVSPPPAPISGTTGICAGATTTLTDAGGGGWYSSNPSVAAIGFGTGVVSGISAGTVTITYSLGTTCISTTTFTVNPLPAAITGTFVVCPGVTSALADVSSGGTWSSANTSVATIGSGTGVLTGVAGGNTVVTYTLPTGCINTTAVTVNPIAPITGTATVCAGSTTSLGDSLTGGTWVSTNPSLATVGSSSGVVTGVAAGNPSIIYLLPTGCTTSTMLTVNPIPAAIAGTMNVCEGSTVTLSDATTGGAWSSSDISTAAIGSGTGIVSGVSSGTCTISYTLPTGCFVTGGFVVNSLPSSILGTAQSCIGLTDTLSDVPTGGSWSSSATSIATIGSGNGVVMGVTSGNAIITYTLPTGCIATTVYTVNPLPNVDTVTGGGAYCAGTAGSHITLSGSDTGIVYQVYRGTTAAGSFMAGTGLGLDFGTFAVTGTYIVKATNTTTSCSNNMYGSAVITINPLPGIKTVTGGGHYCVGDTGVHVGLGGSDTGIVYQLYRGGSAAVGSPLPGVGHPLDFGLQAVPGYYTVTARNATTSCVSDMADTAHVYEDTLYTPVVTIVAHPASINYGQSDTLTAVVTNGGPGVTYQWMINASYIAGATTASYTYTNTDFANRDSITCFVSSHSNCGSVISADHKIIDIRNVGVSQVTTSNMDLKLIPNPNNGMFSIKGSLGTGGDQDVTLTIVDMLGQQVYRNTVKATGGNIDEQIQLSGALANGMYILDVRSGTESKIFHFVLKQ